MNLQYRTIKRGIIAFIGFMLSPLSWWNDIYVNIPLAYVLAIPFAFLGKNSFMTAFVAFYWLSNVVGLALLHWGVGFSRNEEKTKITKKQLVIHGVIAVLYSVVMVMLIKNGYLKMPTEYFGAERWNP